MDGLVRKWMHVDVLQKAMPEVYGMLQFGVNKVSGILLRIFYGYELFCSCFTDCLCVYGLYAVLPVLIGCIFKCRTRKVRV